MMTSGYIWGMIILFSVGSFVIISVIIIIKGFGEIKDIFKKLSMKNETNNNK